MSSITGMGFSTYTNYQTQRANTEHSKTSVTTNLVSEKSDVSLSDARSNSGSESIKKSGDFLAEVESAIRNSHSESGLSGSELNKETVKAYSLPLWLSSYTAGSVYKNNVGVSLDNGLYTVSDPIKKGKVEGVYNLPDDQRERYNELVVSNYYSAIRQSGIKTPEHYVSYLNSDNRSNQIQIEEIMNNLMKDDSELMELIKAAKTLI